MAYTILNNSNLEGYLFSLPKIKAFFAADSLIIEEIYEKPRYPCH